MPTNPQYSEKATPFIVRFERRDPKTGVWSKGYARTRRFSEEEAIQAVQQNHTVANQRNRTSYQYRNYRAEVDDGR